MNYILLSVAFLTLVATPALAAPSPIAAPADCVRDDTIICTERVVSGAELASGRPIDLARTPGLPPIDRVELCRIDVDTYMLVEYLAVDPRLQGMAF